MNEFNFSEIESFEELLNLLNNSGDEYNTELINHAYEFAKKYHSNTLRQSGKPTLTHILTVAAYIARLKLDTTSVVAALLHDVIERSDATIEEINKEFGIEVAFIVDGLSNIRKLSHQVTGEGIEDLENFKKLIFNASEDIRIVIIRIAEKLHNLISSENVPTDILQTAAKKGMKIYAPLCEHLGLGIFQRKMEETAFAILNPKEYQIISDQIENYFANKGDLIENFQLQLNKLLKEYNLKHDPIQTRRKSIYSAYLKIKRKGYLDGSELTPDMVGKLYDIYAARLIVESVEDCYVALGLLQTHFNIIQEEFIDYISNPKPNGYKSIHMIINFMNASLEVQIRTKEMHEYSEFGPACHLIYKHKANKNKGEALIQNKDLVKWQNDKSTNNDFYRIKLFADSVFIFTPKGLVIRLDKGSTPLDFAFRIHTSVGYCYAGAKVNGKMVNMNYKLDTGDIVEVITQKKENVSLDWIKSAYMNSTKARIRKRFNK
ncbi:MAG: HD domain-containing protein [Candidatus Dojkabacteria bacterium]